MDKKKMVGFMLLSVFILGLSCLMPLGIDAVSRFLVSRITQDSVKSQTEGQQDTGMVSAGYHGEDKNQIMMETQDGEDPSEDEPVMERETQTEKAEEDENGLLEYRKRNDPELTESENGAIEKFVSDRKGSFTDAISDHLYSQYGDAFTIMRINLAGCVKEEEDEISYQIEVYADLKGKEYSEKFICSYHRTWDFYSIYPYQDLTDGKEEHYV